MEICFVIPRAYSLFNSQIKNHIGGTERQMFHFAQILSKDDSLDVSFCVTDFGQEEVETYNRIKVWKSFKLTDNKIVGALKLTKTLKKINADTYIFQAANIAIAPIIFYIKKVLKKKTIYMLASDGENSYKQLKDMTNFFTAFSMNYTYKHCDVLTVQSKFQEKEIFKNRKRKPNAIIKNIAVFSNKTEPNICDKSTILWVGRLDPVKQAEVYLDLAKEFSNEEFVMIAPPTIEFPKYGERIKSKSVGIKNLNFIEYVEPENVFSYYEKAKIYITTSKIEGFSNTMMEAMYSKCPVLSLKVNPDNIITDYNSGHCANDNIRSFKNFFNKLLSNKQLREQQGENAYKYISENHNPEIIIKHFKELI